MLLIEFDKDIDELKTKIRNSKYFCYVKDFPEIDSVTWGLTVEHIKLRKSFGKAVRDADYFSLLNHRIKKIGKCYIFGVFANED